MENKYNDIVVLEEAIHLFGEERLRLYFFHRPQPNEVTQNGVALTPIPNDITLVEPSLPSDLYILEPYQLTFDKDGRLKNPPTFIGCSEIREVPYEALSVIRGLNKAVDEVYRRVRRGDFPLGKEVIDFNGNCPTNIANIVLGLVSSHPDFDVYQKLLKNRKSFINVF